MFYENNWESLNARPVPSWFGDAKFGIFIHWGLYSVPAFGVNDSSAPSCYRFSEWYGHNIRTEDSAARAFHDRIYGKNFRYEDFVPMFKAELFDAKEWTKLFKDAGAKYINFVSKHHDGFCMYQSDYAWNWNSYDVGPHRDFLYELRDAMEGSGVRFGVYHSIYEWFNPLYLENPERYALEHLHPMLKELIEKYQPNTLFTDGEWDHEDTVWHSTEFLQWLYNESSVRDVIVPNDRWGKSTRGVCGGNFTTEYGEIGSGKSLDDITDPRPFEECRGIGRSFGYNRTETAEDYVEAKQLLKLLCSLVSAGGNLLLNIGPAADGTIPPIMQQRLLDMGKWLSINGDAIYGSRVYTKEKTDGMYYTKNNGKIYAIVARYPYGEVTFDKIPYSENAKVELLGNRDIPIAVLNRDGKLTVALPNVNPDDINSKWLYTFEVNA